MPVLCCNVCALKPSKIVGSTASQMCKISLGITLSDLRFKFAIERFVYRNCDDVEILYMSCTYHF